MQSNIKGLLFDKDGTLFDFRQTWGGWTDRFLGHIADSSTLADTLAAAIGFDRRSKEFSHDSPAIAGTPSDIAEEIAPFLPDRSVSDLTAQIIESSSTAPQISPVPLVAFLRNLRSSGFFLGVATNDAEASARAHLQQTEIEDCFDFIAGYDSGFGPKPGAGMPRAFLAATGLEPSQAVMIGDSMHDLLAGQAAGLRCIGVLTGTASERTLASLADSVLPSIADLPEWLGLPPRPPQKR